MAVTPEAPRASTAGWLRDSFAPSAIFILAMIVGLGVPVLAMLPVFGGSTSYSVSNSWARIVLVVSALLPILIWSVPVLKRYRVQRPTLKDVAISGVKFGLAMFLALSALRAFETANGYFDAGAENISAPVLDIVERRLRSNTGLHTSYYLVVEDWHGSGQNTELFWGSGYPEGWNVTGNCLNATVGPGALGLRWIADEKIAPCLER